MDSNDIKFSIIMPCYNSGLYVEKAIKSVYYQSYSNWELIAINDGSNDNTLDILRFYAQIDSRIKVFSKKNGGYPSAINYGLDKITGDYFLFLGSDDILDIELLNNIFENILKISFVPDLIGFRTVRMIDDIISEIDVFTSFDTIAYLENTSFYKYTNLYPNHAMIFCTRDTSKCYKTSLLKQLRYFGKYGIDADGIFSMLISHKSKSFLSIPYNGYYWKIRGDSLSATVSNEKNIDRIKNWINFYNELEKKDIVDNRLVPMEIYYIDTLLGLITKTCYNINNSIRYNTFLKCSALSAKIIALKYAPNKLKNTTRIISVSPVAFSILYNVKKLIDNHLKRI